MEHIENTREFMSKFRLLLEDGETLTLPIQGNSMAPFLIHQRDTVRIAKPTKPLKVGDIVLYERSDGTYILHRICAVKPCSFTLVGDAHTVREAGIKEHQIFGIVVSAQRKGITQQSGSFWWEFFQHIWSRIIPLRPLVLKIYSLLTKR